MTWDQTTTRAGLGGASTSRMAMREANMKRWKYWILSRIPIYGSLFRAKHAPLVTNALFDDGTVDFHEFWERVSDWKGSHPDEEVTAEVVDEVLAAMGKATTSDASRHRRIGKYISAESADIYLQGDHGAGDGCARGGN